jgi:hypothetical protein
MSAELVHDPRAEVSPLHSGTPRVLAWRSALVGLVVALGIFLWHEVNGTFDCFSNMGDEGMEVDKAVLVAAGHRLYTEVWNDQPPLYTHLLSIPCRRQGVTMSSLRRATFVFVAILLVAFAGVGGSLRLSLGELVCAGGFLAASPVFLPSSASTTLELPALSLGLLGAWMLLVALGRDSTAWAVAGGVVLGLGVMVKLTAFSVLPLVAGAFWVGGAVVPKRRLLLAGGALVACLLTAAAVWRACAGEASWRHLVNTHFAEYPALDSEDAASYRFRWDWFAAEPWLVGAALVGVAVLAGGGRRPAAVVLASWTLAVLLVFSTHFPWWPYYSDHLSLPLALLAGTGLWGGVRWVSQGPAGGLLWFGLKVLVALAMATCLWEWGEAFHSEWRRVHSQVAWADRPAVRCLREGAGAEGRGRTMLALVQGPYAVHCGLKPLPWYAVMPRKRFWTGQLTQAELVARVRERAADVLIVPAPDRLEPAMLTAIQTQYTPLCAAGEVSVWVAR